MDAVEMMPVGSAHIYEYMKTNGLSDVLHDQESMFVVQDDGGSGMCVFVCNARRVR